MVSGEGEVVFPELVERCLDGRALDDLDGVYTGFGPSDALAFRPAAPLRDHEVEALCRHIHALVIGRLRRLGHLDANAHLDHDAGAELDELGTLHAAAIQGLIPFGPKAGLRTRLCDGDSPRRSAVKKKLCADHRGFSLHAAVRIGAGKTDRLERLVRYVARPPFAQDRLSVTANGDIVYRFRHPWRNGKTAVVMDPMTFMARLAAQVPPPRRHVLTYHGVLAPAAGKREQIVPGHDGRREASVTPRPASKQQKAKPARFRPERYSWSELMLRTFLIDVLACPCGGRRRVLSLVCDPAQIYRYLTHLGLPTDPPERAPPRAVPRALPFGG